MLRSSQLTAEISCSQVKYLHEAAEVKLKNYFNNRMMM